MVRAAVPRLDDRRRLDRDPQEPHRRAPVRAPVRPAPAQTGRGGGVAFVPDAVQRGARTAMRSLWKNVRSGAPLIRDRYRPERSRFCSAPLRATALGVARL